MVNSLGFLFKLTSFGESHGPAIGGVIDGCPPNLEIDFGFIQNELNRRRPGQSSITTSRQEDDKVEFLSGIYEGKTTGTPIGFIVRNSNQHSSDYNNLKDTFRPSHADYAYYKKYGIRDHRGGGRSSARETISRCVAGAIAKLYLKRLGISVTAYTSRVGNIATRLTYKELDLNTVDNNAVRCPDPETAGKMIALIEKIKSEGDTIGGVITCVIQNVPAGLGEPVFGKLHQALGGAMLSINAVKGFEYGVGFAGSVHKGSEINDLFYKEGDRIKTKTNFSGGIQGGISNGEDIYFNVAFKPVATIFQEQETIDYEGNKVSLIPEGRHDPCVLPRAVPVVESMAAMVIFDHYLLNKLNKV